MYYVAMSASSNTLETSIPEFPVVKEGDVASSPSPLVKSKRSANRYLFAVGNHSHSHPHCIYFVAMSASSNALETSIPEFSALTEGDVTSSPSPLVKSKDRQTGICLPLRNCSYSHPPRHLLSWNGRFQR